MFKRKTQISYLHTAMCSICKRLSSDWLCPAVAFLVLANTIIGACGWNHQTACRKPTLTGTGTVALRLIEAKHVKLEASYEESTSTNKGTSTVGNFHIGRPNWYSHNLGDDGVIYLWIGYEYPIWIKTSDRKPINPVQCELGEYVASLIVTDGDVTLIRDAQETKLEAPEPGGITGYVTVFG